MAKNSPFFINVGPGLSMMIGLPTINSWDTKDRPKNPKPGTFGFNSETNNIEYWNGTDWLAAPMGEL